MVRAGRLTGYQRHCQGRVHYASTGLFHDLMRGVSLRRCGIASLSANGTNATSGRPRSGLLLGCNCGTLTLIKMSLTLKCGVCGQRPELVAMAEQRLPSGALEIVRCSGCGRALWYRSHAQKEIQELRQHLESTPLPVLKPADVKDDLRLTKRRARLQSSV